MRAKFKKVLEVGKDRLFSKMEISTKDSSRVENDTVRDCANLQPLEQFIKVSGARTDRWELVFCFPYQTS